MAPVRNCKGTTNKFYMAEILRLNCVISLFIIFVGIHIRIHIEVVVGI